MKHKKIQNIFKKALVITTVVAMNFLLLPTANAAALTSISATPSRATASVVSNHTFKFTTPTGVAAGQTMTVVFPAGYSLTGVVFGDVDISWGATTGLETNDVAATALAGTPSGATWGALVSGQTLTITSGTSTVPAGNVVIIEIGLNATYGGTGTHQITNPTAGTHVVTLTAGPSDSGSVALPVNANDQVTLSANVDASMTFSVSASTSAFGTLSTGSVTTASPGITLTVGTNTATGYSVYVRDQGNGTNAGLYNTVSNYNMTSGTALLSAGTEGYGIQASSAGATIASPYNVTGNNVGALSRTATSLATYGTFTAANHTITVNHLAAISASTRAGSYADTLTYVATGNF
jgi:hypothetical protein